MTNIITVYWKFECLRGSIGAAATSGNIVTARSALAEHGILAAEVLEVLGGHHTVLIRRANREAALGEARSDLGVEVSCAAGTNDLGTCEDVAVWFLGAGSLFGNIDDVPPALLKINGVRSQLLRRHQIHSWKPSDLPGSGADERPVQSAQEWFSRRHLVRYRSFSSGALVRRLLLHERGIEVRDQHDSLHVVIQYCWECQWRGARMRFGCLRVLTSQRASINRAGLKRNVGVDRGSGERDIQSLPVGRSGVPHVLHTHVAPVGAEPRDFAMQYPQDAPTALDMLDRS
ncbi:hypothetical protein H4582DRAFT_2052215 [Lactarius indigo]|nr:hypothetical protein H4582DRAFT_2052215 [Lactarius indigo]